jgi:pimeloyl-CoA synthetase
MNFNFSLVTNWASFYTNVVFDESCPLIYHSPLLSSKEMGFQDFMIIFKCNEKQLGLMIFSRTKNDLSEWINGIGNEFLEPF